MFIKLSVMFLMMLYTLLMISYHPLILGVLIIFQAMTTSLLINNLFVLSWFSMILFIVYLGGILMIFSYFISISKSNQKFFEKKNFVYTFSLALFIEFMSMALFKEQTQKFYFLLKEILFSSFSTNLFLLSILLMSILLFCMICVVFITEKSKGNMKSL